MQMLWGMLEIIPLADEGLHPSCAIFHCESGVITLTHACKEIFFPASSIQAKTCQPSKNSDFGKSGA